MNPSAMDDPRRQSIAGRSVRDSSNTDDFTVVEQNSQRVNIQDISMIPEVANAVLVLYTDDGLRTVKAFISAGKRFSEAIVSSRNTGGKFMRTMGLIINIQSDSDKVTHTDLTKQRTMALCHKILYQSGKCNDFRSP